MIGDTTSSGAADARWQNRCWLLLAGLLIFRAGYAALVPLELVPDEAYYWDWSRQPDWSYFSKPPMVAWLIGLTTAVGGSHEVVIRSAPVLLSGLSLLGVFAFASRLSGSRTGFWSVVLCAASPGAAAASLLMTIDAPLMCCWIWALYCGWKVLGEHSDRLLTVVCGVTVVGLGILSKQTMLAFPALAGVFLLTSRSGWRQLRRPAVWTFLLAPLLFLIPVIVWNVHHDWVTLSHTASHFQSGTFDPVRRLTAALEFVASQCLLISPVTWFLSLCAVWLSLCHVRRLTDSERFLLCFGGIPLIAATLLSLTRRVQPNWPAPFWVACIILAVAVVHGASPVLRLSFPPGSTLRNATVCGLALLLATCVYPFASESVGANGSVVDTMYRLRGWRALAGEVATHRSAMSGDQLPLVICATWRDPVSELAFYLPDQPRVYRWTGGIVDCQHGIWGGPADGIGRNAVIVSDPGYPTHELLTRGFESSSYIDTICIPLGGDRVRRYDIYRGVCMKDWPGVTVPLTRSQYSEKDSDHSVSER